VELIASPLRNENGEVEGIIEIARDITSYMSTQRELEEQKVVLHKLAHHDALTSLPNRLLFLDRLQQAIKKAHRSNSRLAVLFVDLDRFKQINDSLGHAMGDAVLKAVARRLEGCLREDDVVARLGGDEFTIIMDSLHDTRHVIAMAQKLIGIVQNSVKHEELELYVSASVGIALYPQDGEDAEVLLRNADAAMYRAKSEGKNSFQFYTAEMTEQAFERVLMESHLHRALESDQFTVLYQPQMDLRTNKLIGLEALVRWQHPELGQLSPSKFITLAEDTGLILPLGEQVLRTACEQITTWYQAGLQPGRVAVNVTANQLGDADFQPMIERILEQSGCRPQWLELEITEGVIMQRQERSFQILQRLKNLGIELAIDDFGTGYSSLAYLKRLPVSKLKIDRSFIKDIPQDDSDNAIARAVIAMGRSLDLRVIAEGVERARQAAFLKKEGCDEVQGYLYGTPMPADQVTECLNNPLNSANGTIASTENDTSNSNQGNGR
jgi:diguanylate cyclase (GGDEF)-like protein